MINSTKRKLALSGWLKNNNGKEYDTPLKLQKFLLFYELFSDIDGDEADFSHLRGYARGPVFSAVWGDYTKERVDFDKKAEEAYRNSSFIDTGRAKLSAFIVSVLSDGELSAFTHELNLWKSKEERIQAREYNVTLEEKDFNENDKNMMLSLSSMFPHEMISDSVIHCIGEKYFVFSKKDAKTLTEQDFDVLAELSTYADLHNPVYVEKDNSGRLIVD